MLFFLCLFLISGDYHKTRVSDIRKYFFQSLGSTYLLISTPVDYVKSAWDYLSSHKTLVDRNLYLEYEILKLNGKLQKFQSILHENNRLRQLLHASENEIEDTITADVVEVLLQPNKQQILINKGRYHGLKEGLPVIDSQGVIGFISEVNEWISQVILVSDPNFAIPVENSRNGNRGIVIGKGDPNTLGMLHVTDTLDMKEGDVLVTSGLGGRFPPGYPVGKIEKITKEQSSPFLNVVASPIAGINSRRHLLVVTKNVPKEVQDNGDT